MANMSYCRFRNTLDDLMDCVTALDGVVYDNESISEKRVEMRQENERVVRKIYRNDRRL